MDRPDINKAIRARFGRPVRNRAQQRQHERDVVREAGPKKSGYTKNAAERQRAKRAKAARRKHRA